MKLICIFLLFLVVFTIISIDSIRDYARIQSVGGELAVNEYSSDQISSSDNKEKLAEAYAMLGAFTPVKQQDIPENTGSFSDFYYKTSLMNHSSLQINLHGRMCSGDFIRFLAERHQAGFYIYSLRKLIV